jgi:hypothetical protein
MLHPCLKDCLRGRDYILPSSVIKIVSYSHDEIQLQQLHTNMCLPQEVCKTKHSYREHELLTEAHAQLSVVLNCSRFVYCLPPPSATIADHPPPASCFPSPQTHTEIGSGAVSHDRKFSVGVCH